MNARSHVFEVAVESCQVEDAVLSLFHPVLFHRDARKVQLPSRKLLQYRHNWVPGRRLSHHWSHIHQDVLPSLGLVDEAGGALLRRGHQVLPRPEVWPNIPGVFPAPENTVAISSRKYPLGGLDYSGWDCEFEQWVRAPQVEGEAGRGPGREDALHSRGDEQARVSSQDAEPVGPGASLRLNLSRRPTVPIQGLSLDL